MSFLNTGLGQYLLGATDLADDKQLNSHANANGLSVTYTVILPGGDGLAVAYMVQKDGNAALTIGYVIAPTTTTFTINGNLIRAPQHIEYDLPPSLAVAIGGIDIRQGLTTVSFLYDELLDVDMQAIEQQYDPHHPQVTLVYLDETGFWRQTYAQMQPPVLGTRSGVVHNGVRLMFSGIIPN